VKTAIFNWIAFCYVSISEVSFGTRKQQRKNYTLF